MAANKSSITSFECSLDMYSGDLLKLQKEINKAVEAGYTQYDTWYETGYYNDVNEVSLHIK